MALNTDTNQLREIQHQVIVKELYNMIEDNTAKINANSNLFETLSLLRFKGSATALELLLKAQDPNSNKTGDVYNCRDYSAGDPRPTVEQEKAMPIKPGMNVVWTGSKWDEFSYNVDLSPYPLKSELNNLVPPIKVNNAGYADRAAVADRVMSIDGLSANYANNTNTNYLSLRDISDRLVNTRYLRSILYSMPVSVQYKMHHHYTTTSGGILGWGASTSHHDDIEYKSALGEVLVLVDDTGTRWFILKVQVECRSSDQVDITDWGLRNGNSWVNLRYPAVALLTPYSNSGDDHITCWTSKMAVGTSGATILTHGPSAKVSIILIAQEA